MLMRLPEEIWDYIEASYTGIHKNLVEDGLRLVYDWVGCIL